jgi:hypothetical protein
MWNMIQDWTEEVYVKYEKEETFKEGIRSSNWVRGLQVELRSEEKVGTAGACEYNE